MLKITDMNYRYPGSHKKKFEIKDVSLTLEPGMISCLIGRNGAGKTTLLKLICGMIKVHSGRIEWNRSEVKRKDLPDYRRDVAYVGGEDWCAGSLTIRQNTELFKQLYPEFDDAYYEQLMQLADLEIAAEQAYYQLSAGQQMKAELIFALARHPKMLLLDEPLANLDPVFKTDILELIQEDVAKNGTGVLISSHLVDEISEIVDVICVMENGTIQKSGDRFELLGADGEKSLREVIGA